MAERAETGDQTRRVESDSELRVDGLVLRAESRGPPVRNSSGRGATQCRVQTAELRVKKTGQCVRSCPGHDRTESAPGLLMQIAKCRMGALGDMTALRHRRVSFGEFEETLRKAVLRTRQSRAVGHVGQTRGLIIIPAEGVGKRGTGVQAESRAPQLGVIGGCQRKSTQGAAGVSLGQTWSLSL